MTARTYAYLVEDAPPPSELKSYKAIEQFGVTAVTGRDVLTHSEITGMKIANVFTRLFQARKSSNAWAEWEQKNPQEAAVLEAAKNIWQATR